ncbi:MAG: hypothetical protein HYY30_02410, partial [Chloroflexi bacterium]|nr:hypothetical protein [Chloroflexota bacterium]
SVLGHRFRWQRPLRPAAQHRYRLAPRKLIYHDNYAVGNLDQIIDNLTAETINFEYGHLDRFTSASILPSESYC